VRSTVSGSVLSWIKKSVITASHEGRIGGGCKLYDLELDEATNALDISTELLAVWVIVPNYLANLS